MYDKELNEVDKFKYTKEIYNTSFARVPDGSSNIGPITMNSPGKSNNNRIIATEICATPKIGVEGTFFSSSVKFFATCETPDVVLRYTSTGVEPTMSSPRFPETYSPRYFVTESLRSSFIFCCSAISSLFRRLLSSLRFCSIF